jgi:hypothetical protein
MAQSITIQDFLAQFPDDDACLAHLFKQRYGDNVACERCGEIGKFRKLAKMPAYTCNCGHHIHPMVGTPFGRTRVPLQKWFYAMYLFTTSRHGVPAKELERQLGVHYETAWRMAHELRKHMTKVDGDDQLSGHVEADEAMIGGKHGGGKRGRGAPGKTVVFGMLERQGDVMTRSRPHPRSRTRGEVRAQNERRAAPAQGLLKLPADLAHCRVSRSIGLGFDGGPVAKMHATVNPVASDQALLLGPSRLEPTGHMPATLDMPNELDYLTSSNVLASVPGEDRFVVPLVEG